MEVYEAIYNFNGCEFRTYVGEDLKLAKKSLKNAEIFKKYPLIKKDIRYYGKVIVIWENGNIIRVDDLYHI